MESSTAITRTTHPLLLIAAASVTALSFAGVGVMAGWLPLPNAGSPEPLAVATATPAAIPSALPAAAPVTIQQTFNLPPERAPAAVAKPTTRPTAPSRAKQPAKWSAPIVASAPASPPLCVECGTVVSVNAVAIEGKPSGGGAVAGGVLGGIVGNQVGAGSGRDLATLAGIFGGAIAGHHVEKNMKERKRYDVVVRFEDGQSRTFSGETVPSWYAGERVKLEHGVLTRRDGNNHGIDVRPANAASGSTAMLGSID